MGRKVAKLLWDYAVITLGCLLYALAFNGFIRNNGFVMGGFTGIGQIVNRLLPKIPVGTVILVLNLPLLGLFIRKQGIKGLLPTVYAIFINAVLIDGVQAHISFPPMAVIPAFLWGGGLMGLSLGLLLRKNATTGGTELLARLLKYRYRHLSMGRLCLTIDVSIIAMYALVFTEPENAVYGAITMLVASRVMDMVLYGSINAKLAVIISDRGQEIAKAITTMNLGATMLRGAGAWSGGDKQVILCVFKYPNIAAIQTAVTQLDPHVFFVVCDAREVLGEGFGTYNESPGF